MRRPLQTSARAIRAGTQEFVRRLGAKPKHVVVNLEEYGNTSSATLFVALHKYLEEQRIHSGDRVMLLALAAGIEIGSPYSPSTARRIVMGTRIEAASALTSRGLRKPTARRLAGAAARTCLAHAGKEPGDVDMLINAGIYRKDSMGEPVLAALIQEDIVPRQAADQHEMEIECKPGYAARLADCAEEASRRFLRRLGLGWGEIDLVVPAPSSPDFLDALVTRLGVPATESLT